MILDSDEKVHQERVETALLCYRLRQVGTALGLEPNVTDKRPPSWERICAVCSHIENCPLAAKSS